MLPIIVGSKSDHPEKELENFWIEIAESSPNIVPDFFVFDYDNKAKRYIPKKISAISANAPMFGVPKMFTPVWCWPWSSWNHNEDDNNRIYDRNKREQLEHHHHYDFLNPRNWTYIYDHFPLAKTLDKYIDYKRLNLAPTKEELPEVLRLIITAVDVLTARPLIFDNAKMEIKAKHIPSKLWLSNIWISMGRSRR